MGRRSKSKSKPEFSEDEDNRINQHQKSRHTSSFVFPETDDEEANEDLSLKIVEKAMSRASHAGDSEVTVNGGGGDDVVTTELVASEIVKKKKKKSKKEKKEKKKKKKAKRVESDIEINMATLMNEEDKGDPTKDAEVVNLSEPDGAANANANNEVLRRLLRGPRYFDPPDKSWGACFNCGEEGHTSANCTSARKKKPCFICGSLEHEVKQCQKGKDCFICKGGDHRARDCPKKFKRCSQASELCLKCGASAHGMSSCNNDYSQDDLKEIQCYVCKKYGHLCCVDYLDGLLGEASCYKCGQSGHNGQACRGSQGETSAAGTPNLCYKCGEEGHFVRECRNSTKAKKRNHEFSTPTRKYSRDSNASKGFKSAPHDFGKTHRKRLQFDNGSPDWSSRSKRRGGWIPDDPSDFPPMTGWRSPATPNKKHKIYDLNSGSQGSSSHSKRWGKYSSGTPSSQGYGNGYQHRYSASRFGNSSNDGTRRNYDWW